MGRQRRERGQHQSKRLYAIPNGTNDRLELEVGRPVPPTSVVVTVELHIEVTPDRNAIDLEGAIGAEGRRAARELYGEMMRVLDELATQASGTTRQRLEARWVATPFGRVRLWRHRVKEHDRTFHPLDRMYGLGRSEYSPALQALIGEFSPGLPYRRAAEALSRIVGEPLSYQSVWRLLHADGNQHS